ncbi:cytochrome P450 714B3-like isoform X2 [Asparagus officinalis]|uniref:cytochrome P450 714B3-like isoform X2 n=1 Tax=Asparagus officinalis TaxID=4686 RepID=UPI00098E836A|nr:cytochrome P450 714B3-like isoform X2 [Asparagus officinalis]
MEFFLSFGILSFCSLALYLYNVLWLHPQKICKKLRRQGIDGPKPSFLHGNLKEMKMLAMEEKRRDGEAIIHDYTPLPYFEKWRKRYGSIFLYMMGNVPFLHVSNPDFLRDMSHCASLDLGKSTYLKETHEPLFGNSIVKSNGKAWAHQRKIIAPEFFLEKAMVNLMVDCMEPLTKSWESKIEQGNGSAEIKVDEDLQNFSAEVISRACFRDSYSEGRQIVLKLREMLRALSRPNLLVEIAGLRYLPTRLNREIWRLNKEVRSLILKVTKENKEREEHTTNKNLLQAILQNAGDSSDTDDFIVDNCKTIYIAGHETTAITAVWCLLLLSIDQEWQSRVRADVVEILGGCPPDANSIQKMKMLTMVIQETLRLYPPTAVIARETLQDIKLGGIQIPKGVHIHTPVTSLHHDSSIWGPDVHEFNPERFSRGISAACKFPHTYVPFGFGSRTCLGQNFAMVELKILLSLILSKFSFSLSQEYRHCPSMRLLIEPKFGVCLLMKKCN